MHKPAAAPCIAVMNCGSSSIKAAVFEIGGGRLPRQPLWRAELRGLNDAQARLTMTGQAEEALALPSGPARYPAAIATALSALDDGLGGRQLLAVAHRVVHGGAQHSAPLRLDRAALAELRALTPLAPLHQPFALDAAERMMARRPDLPQIACFDTAFHHGLPMTEQRLALPREWHQRGLRRYGFHGLSYEYQSIALAERHGWLAHGRCIVAHLGSGASLCAMHEGRSVATTMGFSALDGLMMGTRCGSLDPGVLLYLMQQQGLDAAALSELLYHRSGLLGVSGRSADPTVLLAHEADDADAAAALALFVHRAVREIGALTAVLGGLDLLVFTGGIGEHLSEIRRRIAAPLGYLGVELDEQANLAHATTISLPSSPVRVAVEPTNEEWMAASQLLQMPGILHPGQNSGLAAAARLDESRPSV